MTETSRTTGRATKPVRGDVTALQAQALEEQRDAKLAQEAADKARLREVEDFTKKNTVIDYSGADVPLPEPEKAESDEPYRVITIKYAIEQMAFGREVLVDAEYNEHGECTRPAQLGGIRFFDFDEGRRYNVPRAMADHLDERGLVWH
jgi:hypothetical protein